MSEPDGTAKADMTLDALDRADKWAADINLYGIIQNMVLPMRLNRAAPDDVRESFIRRMEQQIDAMMRQAYVEGACFGRFGDTGDDEVSAS